MSLKHDELMWVALGDNWREMIPPRASPTASSVRNQVPSMPCSPTTPGSPAIKKSKSKKVVKHKLQRHCTPSGAEKKTKTTERPHVRSSHGLTIDDIDERRELAKKVAADVGMPVDLVDGVLASTIRIGQKEVRESGCFKLPRLLSFKAGLTRGGNKIVRLRVATLLRRTVGS